MKSLDNRKRVIAKSYTPSITISKVKFTKDEVKRLILSLIIIILLTSLIIIRPTNPYDDIIKAEKMKVERLKDLNSSILNR